MQRAQKEETYYNKIRKHFDRVKARLGTKIFIITITSLILAVLSLLYLLIAPRCRKKPSDDSYPHSGDEHEVGFTEGVDVTASELNLARAYIEMGDEERAKPMLMRILLHGNDYEQAEAKELLNQMKEG
jgi:FimV-like protein